VDGAGVGSEKGLLDKPQTRMLEMGLILIVVILLLLFGGGGGYYGYRTYGGIGGIIPLILVILVLVWLLGGGYLHHY
jgi:hypothetical protein